MIRRALVQVRDPRTLSDEAKAATAVLAARGVSVTHFTLKNLRRGRLELGPESLVAGDLDAVPLALKKLGARGPFVESYPSATHPFLARKVWKSTLTDVKQWVEARGEPLFVKPGERLKRFTGFVYTSRADDYLFQGASHRAPVDCSTVVQFVREFRAYVVGGVVVGVCQYAGESGSPPEPAFVERVLGALREQQQLVAGFALDVGVLADGQPAVVECNDGFGLGLYPGLNAEVYADLLCARWEELMRGREPA